MKVSTPKAGSAILFCATASLSFGIAVGVVKTLKLGVVNGALAIIVIMLIQWLIFRSGRKSAWSSAQAWAQANVDIAIEVSNVARAEAKALSNAYASAIATANANAQNVTYLQVGERSVLPLQNQEQAETVRELQQTAFPGQMSDYSEILNKVKGDLKEGITSEISDENGSPVAMGEQ